MKIAVLLLGVSFSSICLGIDKISPESFDAHLGLSTQKRTSHLRPVQKPKALVSGVFRQSIDHFGQLPGQTFNQRYWVNSDYATQPDSAPVIFHICGEGDVDGSYFLNDSANEWAKTLGAHIVYLEHRYYGQSLPFSDLATDHMAYLTLDNVIEDLASFQKWISAQNNWTGKWVSVGGSYSGTLSAIYRLKHPELVSGALASSAPMISGEDEQEDDPPDSGDILSTDPSNDTGARQWVYQACTTFGFWESDGSVIYDPSREFCQQVFPNAPFVNSTTYNQAYYLPFITSDSTVASNILFTYGGDDIWTQIGISQKNNKNKNVSVLVIPGAGHHDDLNAPDPSDSPAVIKARATFVKLAQQWLGI